MKEIEVEKGSVEESYRWAQGWRVVDGSVHLLQEIFLCLNLFKKELIGYLTKCRQEWG